VHTIHNISNVKGTESLYSLVVLKSPEISSHWTDLGHVFLSKPITVAKGLDSADWPKSLSHVPQLITWTKIGRRSFLKEIGILFLK